jgi:hypothetical protein
MSDSLESDTAAVCWPGVILHTGDPELVYVADRAAWEREAALLATGYAAPDCLIDATGRVFVPGAGTGGCLALRPRGDAKSLVEILGLVKAHAAQAGSCCVAKLYAASIREAFGIVQSLDDAPR